MESALGDSKPRSGTKKSLEARVKVSSEASIFKKLDLTKNKIFKMNQVQRPDDCWLMICCSTRNTKGDHLNINKHKLTMISSKMVLTPISDLRERLCQIRQARQTSSMITNLLAKHSMFSRLSLTSPTLHSVCQYMRGLNIIWRNLEWKPKLAHATVIIIGCGDPTSGVAHPESPPNSHFATEADEVYSNTWSRTRSVIASRSISPLRSNSQE